MTSSISSAAISCPPTARRAASAARPNARRGQCGARQSAAPLPTKPSARQWKASLREMRSLRMELMISRRNSSFCAPAGRALAPAPGTRRRRRGRSRARLVQQDRAGHVAHLLLRVPARAGRASRPARAPATAGRARGRGALGGGDQIGRLLVPKLDLVAEHVDVEQLPHILLLVVLCAGATTSARAGAAAASRGRARACHGVAGRKLLADLAQLLVHADLLLLLVGAVADVRNKGLRGARSDAPGPAGAAVCAKSARTCRPRMFTSFAMASPVARRGASAPSSPLFFAKAWQPRRVSGPPGRRYTCDFGLDLQSGPLVSGHSHRLQASSARLGIA